MIVENLNLLFCVNIYSKTTQSCTENGDNLQWKNLRVDKISFENVLENGYSFQKHSFGTI